MSRLDLLDTMRLLVGEGRPPETMAKRRTNVTCDDCYFRREGLCALPGNVPCPTYRAVAAGALSPPTQARLVPRPLPHLAVGRAA